MPPTPNGGPGRRVRGPLPKLKNPGTTLKRLIKYVGRRYTFQMILVVICIVTTAVANVKGTLFLRTLIDDYIMKLIGQTQPDFLPLERALARLVFIYALAALASLVQSVTMMFVSQGTMRSLRDELFAHMQKLPVRYFDTHAHGDIMSVYTNDIDTIRQMVSQSLPQIVSAAITIVSVLGSMILLSIPLTCLTLFVTGLSIFISKKLASKSGSGFVAQQKDIGALNGFVEEMISGQKVVKVFNYEDRAIERFTLLNENLYESSSSANKFANIMGPVNLQFSNLGYVLCAIVGGLLAMTGVTGLSLGSLASYLTFHKNFSMPVNQVTMQVNAIIMGLAGAERIFELMDEECEVDEGYVELVNARLENGEIKECEEHTGIWAWKHFHKADGTTTYTRQEGDVIFADVDFAYVSEKPVLKRIKMFAAPGQKIALVGSTGAGKTTIINLITRFYDLADGKIRYDQININKIKKSDLRKSLGMVLQETHLFTGTVADNIRFGKLDATDEEVIAAAKLANADGFIRQLPDGYNTMLKGNGATLSQGQRQLLTIARAAIADPPVLILDEATSSIDTRTEKIVQAGMDRLMKDRTTFVIAHRLSTIMNSDCIMVLENGEIIERGNHEELMEKKGRYYELFTANSVVSA
ncbi:MAG: ABC transporter ATP-binding protein [Lachnospiraceae bacterium]|nr:ABC transporter ATP-binding protein [Lachnospiraceae bacterium]